MPSVMREGAPPARSTWVDGASRRLGPTEARPWAGGARPRRGCGTPASVAITALAAGGQPPQTEVQRGRPARGRERPASVLADTGHLSATMLDSGARRVHGGSRCQPPRWGRQGAGRGHHHAAVDVAARRVALDAKSALAVRGGRGRPGEIFGSAASPWTCSSQSGVRGWLIPKETRLI